MAAWQSIGLPIGDDLQPQISQALVRLAEAVTHQSDPLAADSAAQQALELAVALSAQVAGSFAERALALRGQTGKLTTLLGVDLGRAPLTEAAEQQLVGAINSVNVPLAWRQIEQAEGHRDWSLSDRQIEWSRSHGMKICAGPMLQLDRCAAPDWLYLWEGDFENLMTLAADFIRAAVLRYRGKVHLWQCAARLNVSDVFSLSEEQRLKLTVLAIEAIRQVRPALADRPVDRPALGRVHGPIGMRPLAVALCRCVGAGGYRVGRHRAWRSIWAIGRGAPWPRDPLEFGRQMDRWSVLGLPLLAMLTLPSSPAANAQARSPAQPLPYGPGPAATPEGQRAWIEHYLPVLLAKQPVQGIFWNQLSDSAPHDFAQAGLFDAAGQPKPALEALRRAATARGLTQPRGGGPAGRSRPPRPAEFFCFASRLFSGKW